jgi:hypothetical protein
MADEPRWEISGDYFENCSCDVVCPCLVSKAAPMSSRPTRGACEVPSVFHIEHGRFGDVQLDGLNVALVLRTPGPMGDGNWTVAAYIDERADDRQAEALGAIFTGAAGGPMAAFSSLIGTTLGVKRAPIEYRVEGKRRSAEIKNILHLSVRPLPSLRGQDEEIWGQTGHPFNPDRLAFAVGDEGNFYEDYGMRWDNSGQNAHYAAINWSNA